MEVDFYSDECLNIHLIIFHRLHIQLLKDDDCMDIVVGIGELAISGNENDVLKTFALGSCVALMAYAPDKKVLGMVHIALPDSSVNSEDGRLRPGHYADTAVPLLINKICYEHGCHKNGLIFNIYGGARSAQNGDVFKIGERNIYVVKKILALNNVVCTGADIGGNYSRTIEADVATGTVKLDLYPMKI